MAVTPFQSEILKRIARSRLDGGETYIAGELEFHEGTIGGAWPRIIG